ncbi:MAG: prolyl oligopeptidase family serine peptidase [Bacteroidia bacterium]|nr:prolyl oligopeptidase family serine peptidase [Bacteroidia bacterium]
MKTVRSLLLLITIILTSIASFGQTSLNYQLPHEDILKLIDAPLPPSVQMNTEGTHALLLYRKAYKDIEELSEPEMRLAGLRINPKTNISSRARYYYDLKVLDTKSKMTYAVDGLPENPKITNVSWSHGESKVAFTNTESDGVALWVLDMKSRAVNKITDPDLNANMGSPIRWFKDDQAILVKVLPEDRPALINSAIAVPSGPTITESDGRKAQNRTYQDLLKNPNDEKNFETLATAKLMKVSLDGASTEWMSADMYRSISLSPDGEKMLIQTLDRPFSYLVPYYRFPTSTDIYDIQGSLVSNVQKMPLIEDLPSGFGSTHTLERNYSWRADKPATLTWVRALDGGDPSAKVEYRDALYEQESPYTGEPKMLTKMVNRYRYTQWGNNNLAIVHDQWFKNRNTKAYAINPSNPNQASKILWDRNSQDNYNNPGSIMTEENEYGRNCIVIDNGNIYLTGRGYSDEGIHPFVDKMNIYTGSKQRLYQAEKNNKLENIRSNMEIRKGIILTSLESKKDYPNYYFRNINTGQLTPITSFENPFAVIQDIHKEIITYKRDDGVELSGTLYLPAGYDMDKKEKLPMILWAYPREYKDKSSAGQITSSENQFTRPSYGSPIFWVTRGFAVLDRAAFPIIGEGDEEPNDSFVKQLVANGKSAIDAVDALGYIDRNRVGVGGHSYGAFMTANLLSHSNLFAAGIARSGAYNRTLTPFGFQREERFYWEAPEIYYAMSPFMHADKMKTPLLLIHGEADNNSGTYPMQSIRYFNALKGLGATARLVMLPKESHGYSARESILHMLYEQDSWLEKHVKNRKETKVSTP